MPNTGAVMFDDQVFLIGDIVLKCSEAVLLKLQQEAVTGHNPVQVVNAAGLLDETLCFLWRELVFEEYILNCARRRQRILEPANFRRLFGLGHPFEFLNLG